MILSQNDPVSGLRVFRSAESGLKLGRGVFTRGRAPYRFLNPLGAISFCPRTPMMCARRSRLIFRRHRCSLIHMSIPNAMPTNCALPFDGDAVLFSDEAERVYQQEGLARFHAHERAHLARPLPPGPFKPLLRLFTTVAGHDRCFGAGPPAHGAGHRAQCSGS